MPTVIDILVTLVSFKTISRHTNLALIEYIASSGLALGHEGFTAKTVSGSLYATIGVSLPFYS